jgi:SAM-dependent methyltransferase
VSGPPPPALSGYDAELRRHQEVLRRACAAGRRDHVLDVGCGTGQTTRQAARAAPAGRALGIDVSAPAIERARALARAENLGNVTFEHADAEVHRFAPGRFDLAISRFGTMFFGDPAAAFANLGQALRPGGRLVMMVWQAAERNEWVVAIARSLGRSPGSGASPLPGLDAFSLADPAAVTRLLETVGFTGVTCIDVREPVWYGPDVAAALDWVQGFTTTRDTLQRLAPAARAQALGRLRDELTAHQSVDGVWFGSRAWLVTARRA